MKPLRVVRPRPDDPGWKFPYCTRATLEKIRDYFESFQTGGHPAGWRERRHKAIIPHPTTPWESVPVHHRERVEKWFQMKLRQEYAKKRPGWPTAGKIRSLRMNAAAYGRYVLTGKRRANHSTYERRKRIWLAYQEWERQQQLKQRPHTSSKLLEVG